MKKALNVFLLSILLVLISIPSCVEEEPPNSENQPNSDDLIDPGLDYFDYVPQPSDIIISRIEYVDKMCLWCHSSDLSALVLTAAEGWNRNEV